MSNVIRLRATNAARVLETERLTEQSKDVVVFATAGGWVCNIAPNRRPPKGYNWKRRDKPRYGRQTWVATDMTFEGETV